MKKITLKNGLLSCVGISVLSIVLYQATADNDAAVLNTSPKVTSSNISDIKQITQLHPTLIQDSKKTADTHQTKKTTIAFQTPSTFPNGPFAPSIEDTEIDGSLKADANGHLIIDLETRDMFDYFMNTVADVPPEVAIAELEKLARANLPESAVNQAMAVLAEYLLYKETALEYASQPLLPADQQDEQYQLRMLEESFERLKTIRRETMSSEAVDAFFGLEEAYGEFTLASIIIQQNADLTPEQMQMELQTQREKLPEVIRNTENRMVEEIETSKEINEVLLSDSRDSEVEAMLRNKGMDEEGINDALEYRQQQRQFEETYALYKKERDQVLSASLSEDDIANQKERLLQKYFETEQAQTQAKVKDLSS